VPTRREGKYEIVTDKPCMGCKLTASRVGFVTTEKKIDYNGSNSLWFSFAMEPEKTAAGKAFNTKSTKTTEGTAKK